MKLSKANRATIQQLQDAAANSLAYETRIICQCQNLPSHITDKSADYYEGQAHGFYMAIEMILFANKAYEGFTIVESEVTAHTATYPDGLRADITTRNYVIKGA